MVRLRHAAFCSPVLPLLVASSFCIAACDRPPSPAQAKEWTAADHDGNEETGGTGRGAGVQAAAGLPGTEPSAARPVRGPKQTAPTTEAERAREVAEIAWTNQCSTCHGPRGQGDGPQGPMVQAPDLSRAEYQRGVTDAALALSIRQGKGKMPKFELSDPVVAALVQKVRSFAR